MTRENGTAASDGEVPASEPEDTVTQTASEPAIPEAVNEAALAETLSPAVDVMAGRERTATPPPPPGWLSHVTAPLRILPPSLTSAGLALALAAGLIVERADVVRQFPETARLYAAIGYPVNLRGLAFRHVTSELVKEGEATILVVEGEIENVEERTISVPLLALSVREASGAELYRWTSEPARPKLGAGDQMRFRARLISPPAGGAQVLVHFASRETDAPASAAPATTPEPPDPSRGNIKDVR